MSHYADILGLLPYKAPFRFVDDLTKLSDSEVRGIYTFKSDEAFYAGHFPGQPVTPGVILTECMAQIGLVCLGIFLLRKDSSLKNSENLKIAFSESQVLFERPVYPNEKVEVTGKKLYWRLGKLKCEVEMRNSSGERVCHGKLSGMIVHEK